MPLPPQDVERLVRLLLWIGGVVTTAGGALFASRVRVYEDNRKAHHDELKAKVLRPLCNLAAENLPFFGHEAPVIVETWGRLSLAKKVRADEADEVYGAPLKAVNPWKGALNAIERALLEDARTTHFKNEISEVYSLANAWEAHSLCCLQWVEEVAGAILKESKMNPYAPPYTPPYILHLRLGVFVYRRLFHLPTEPLRKQDQGKYFSIEGAPTVPNVIGSAGLGTESGLDAVLQILNQIMEANREKAALLQSEAKDIKSQTIALRNRLELAIAKKKLHKRCDLVPFF